MPSALPTNVKKQSHFCETTNDKRRRKKHTHHTRNPFHFVCLGVKGFSFFKCTMLISQFIRESSITAKRNVMLTVCHGRTTALGFCSGIIYINLHFFHSVENVTFLSRIIFATGFLQVRQTRHTRREYLRLLCVNCHAWFHSMQVLFSVSANFRLVFFSLSSLRLKLNHLP